MNPTPETASSNKPAESTAAPPFQRKHLLGLEDLSGEEIARILDEAKGMKEIFTRTIKKVPALRGRTVANLFFENSTRTRTSFELAAKRLSADVINFSPSGSSLSKGESLIDTVRTIEAMGADIVVMRHPSSGAPHTLSHHVDSSIINAGDGLHEHPTQGLLDLFTMREQLGRIAGLKVAIVGDILHSRVARSNVWGLLKLGAAEVRMVGPRTLLPPWFERMGCRLFHNLDEGIQGVDVINILRIQLERQNKNLFPSIREYQLLYGLTPKRIAQACPEALIMHPGPINRGVEIDHAVADGPRSVINQQVTNGVAVRMAVLYLLCGAQGRRTDEAGE
jgi:aspartate carbamoyltransferase catalytic subunit